MPSPFCTTEPTEGPASRKLAAIEVDVGAALPGLALAAVKTKWNASAARTAQSAGC